jgi:hypothetical protein
MASQFAPEIKEYALSYLRTKVRAHRSSYDGVLYTHLFIALFSGVESYGFFSKLRKMKGG